jgi:hypothetical protein
MVDGTLLACFLQRFKELIEFGHGLIASPEDG